MALAKKVSAYGRMADGSAARSLPQAERAPAAQARTAPVRKRSLRPLIFACSLGWVCIMAFSLALVHQNTLAQEESARITALRGELAQIKLENEELERRIEWATSVEAVERYALAKGMVRPVAVRPIEPQPLTTAAMTPPPDPAPAPQARSGFWSALQGFFTSARGAR